MGAFTTGEAAADLVGLADRLGFERFSLLGHSMGGSIAQRLLALCPDRVRRLVGVSPVPASGLPLPPEQWELFSHAAQKPENRRTIIDITTGGVRPAAWLDRMVARSLDRSDTKAFRAWLDSWAGEDFHTQIKGADIPALAVTGALDPSPVSRVDAADMDELVSTRRTGRVGFRRALRDGRDAARTDPRRRGLSARRRSVATPPSGRPSQRSPGPEGVVPIFRVPLPVEGAGGSVRRTSPPMRSPRPPSGRSVVMTRTSHPAALPRINQRYAAALASSCTNN